MEALTRIKSQIDAYQTSIQTCGEDDRAKVLGLLAEQFCETLADLAEDMTGEPGNCVYGCAEGLIDEIKAMFREADDRLERMGKSSGNVIQLRHPNCNRVLSLELLSRTGSVALVALGDEWDAVIA